VSRDGFIGGGQIGYAYLWGDRVVIGLEADIQGASISGTGAFLSGGVDALISVPAQPPAPQTVRAVVCGGAVSAGVDWLGTVRGRAGLLAAPTLLGYATGGLADGGLHAQTNAVVAASPTSPTEGVRARQLIGIYRAEP